MSDKSKNINAFPREDYQGDFHGMGQSGMTLRHYYANSAMKGIIASTEGIGLEINEKHIKIIVKKAFMYADEMLKQSEL